MAVRQLPWHISPASEDEKDARIAEFVSWALSSGGFDSCLGDLLDGISKGFSVVEIIWELNKADPDLHKWRYVPSRYLWRDQRHFGFDEQTQTEIQLLTEDAPQFGEPLKSYRFIQHTPRLKSGKVIRSGLIYTVAALHLMKAFVTKDWLAFSEVFGMPVVYAEMQANATEKDKGEIFTALQALGSDGKALFSNNVKIEFLGVNTTHHGDFYESAVRFWNQEISKVTLGQTMTTEDGASLSQAKVHAEVRNDIRNSDARSLEDTINKQLIAAIVELNFGATATPPSFSFDVSDPEDMVSFSEAIVPFIDRGLSVSVSELYEKFGLSRPEDPVDALSATLSPDNEQVSEPPDSEEMLSALQVSRVLGVPVSQVFALDGAGELNSVRIAGGGRRYMAADVQKMEARASAPFAGTAIE